MTRLLNSKGRDIPVLIDSMGKNAIYIELRVFDENGNRCGVVYQIIDRDDAQKLTQNLIKWLKDTEKGGTE